MYVFPDLNVGGPTLARKKRERKVFLSLEISACWKKGPGRH